MAVDVRPGRVSAGARRSPRARYLPIAEHGLIGDLHTVALVGTDGTIDWYCCPRFDSPSVFAAILDTDRGGLFRTGISSASTRSSTKAAVSPARSSVETLRKVCGHDDRGGDRWQECPSRHRGQFLSSTMRRS
jgi:hypothetical protein